ncbi:MAG: Uncharacterised protein [Hyphomonas sp. TMED17]|nr:MAG: Uncharacterised protein [Hyphomonas sp. TMED17]
MPPYKATIIGLVDAAISADNQVFGIVFINPERVIVDVTMSRADISECLAAVSGPF